MVEAAPQAQPKTTWNAQKDFVQLRVLLGTFLHVFIISARFPFPMSEKVHVLRSFLRVCFGYRFGSQNGAQRVPIGGHFGHLFRVF